MTSTLVVRSRNWLPRGDALDHEAWRQRHRILSILLALHLPAMAAFGILRGQDPGHVGLELIYPLIAVVVAQLPSVRRRWAGLLVTSGLVYFSAVAVHFSGGTIEAHFHFFAMLGFVALYQDWAAFGWAIAFTAMSHGTASWYAPEAMFNHPAGIRSPWTWALIHAGMVLFASAGQIIHWNASEQTQRAATSATASLVAERERADHRESFARLYVNLARRNQALLDRQLAVIDELEGAEDDPRMLEQLFTIDHLAARVRRNAESLLVLAGEEAPRRFAAPVPLAEVARAAIGEVEEYRRGVVEMDARLALTGGLVTDVAHLLAELVENATRFSPPDTRVTLRADRGPEGRVRLHVEDRGIGLSPHELATANRLLAAPPEIDADTTRQLGLHVVARLARRHGFLVHLSSTPQLGTTATVELPPDSVSVIGGDGVAAPPPPPASFEDETTAPSFASGLAPRGDAPRHGNGHGNGSGGGLADVVPLQPYEATPPQLVPPAEPEPWVTPVAPLDPPAAPTALPPVPPAAGPVSPAPEPGRQPNEDTLFPPPGTVWSARSSPAAMADGVGGLPQRVPAASLAPELSVGQRPKPVEVERENDPASWRALLSAFQRGVAAGRTVTVMEEEEGR